MKGQQNILIKELCILLMVACIYSCTTPEERAAENEAKNITKVHTVVIQQMKFTPADITVNEGDMVIWINRDIVDHNVTEETNKEWSSSNLPPGKYWNMVVIKNATYLCTIHPVMKGSLNVR